MLHPGYLVNQKETKMSLNEYASIFQLIANVVTAIGLPFAIITFLFQKQKENKAELENTFHQLDESYVSFMQLCLANPDLDIFGIAVEDGYHPTKEQLRREHAIFGILISLFERAHVMFRDKSQEFRVYQWLGWVEYMKSYCYRTNFIREWNNIGHQFDKQFNEFMERLIEETISARKEIQPTPKIGSTDL